MSSLLRRGGVADFLSTAASEDEFFEAKAAANNIPRNAWETMSAFANTQGGVLLFGVTETDAGFGATGVSDAARLKHDLQTGLRRRQRISCEVAQNIHIWVEDVSGNSILVMVVPEAPRSQKPVYIDGDINESFLRRGESDVQCEPGELNRLIRESAQQTTDNDVIEYLDFSDLDTTAVRRYRKLCEDVGSRHLQDNPRDSEFLTRIGVWRHDRPLSVSGLTRGGLLMFGNELAIREIRPNHVIDYQLQDNPGSSVRWRDRLRWTGHLFGAWEEIAPRLVRSLPIPFRLSGTTRTDQPAGEEAIREALINLLIHTDYQELSDSRIIVSGDGLLFENPGTSRVRVDADDYDAPDHFPLSERRNPLLSSLFAHANLAELAGSGVRSMRNEWRNLGYQVPRFQSSVQEYKFSVFLSLRSMMNAGDRSWIESIGGPWTENEEFALLLARDGLHVDNQQLREISGLHPTDVTRVLQSLRDRSVLIQEGYGKGTSYRLPTALEPGHLDIPGDSTVDTSYGHRDTSYGHKDISKSHKREGWSELKEIAAPVASTKRVSPMLLHEIGVKLCMEQALNRSELMSLLDRSAKTIDRAFALLVSEGRLRFEEHSRTSPNQRYRSTIITDPIGEN